MPLFSKIFGNSRPAFKVEGTKFESRSLNAAQQEIKELRNRYESAQPSSPRRSWVPAFVRDARFDANSFTRWELVRKIRYFEQNTWLVQKLREVFVKYTVGPNGLTVIPASSDRKWNKAAARAYAEWCKQPCIDSREPMGQVHKKIAGETHIDGEIFILKTRFKAGARSQSLPRIKLIESHRCSSPGSLFGNSDNKDLVDGVRLNSDGLPISYAIRDGFDGEEWVERDAANVIHVAEFLRVGEYRALTPYRGTLNTAHDLDDLALMEMDRAKEAASISNVVQTWNGELNPETYRQSRFQQAKQAGIELNEEKLNQRMEYYQKVLGSRTVALKAGEEMKQFNSNQPSASTQWYWKFLIGQVCASQGIPLLLVLPDSMQGTVVRGVLDDADLFFKSKFALFAHAAVDMYLFFLDWARYNIRELADAPGDWNACHVIGPRAVNVDKGNTAASQLALYSAGMTNMDDIAGPLGLTGEILIRRKAESVRMIMDVAEEYEIDPAQISAPIADVMQSLALAEQASAQATASTAQAEAPQKESAEA